MLMQINGDLYFFPRTKWSKMLDITGNHNVGWTERMMDSWAINRMLEQKSDAYVF